MAGYLDAYGVDDARREKAVKWIVISIVAIAIVTGIAYLVLQHWGEKQRAKEFLELLRKQDYRAAYQMFGCSDSNPCRDYPFESFMEDWGSQSVASQLRLGDTEECGTGVLINLVTPKEVEATLLVETETGRISYAPWPECPERRFRLMKWLRMRFAREAPQQP
jgi:hypothetical protein